MGGYRLAFDVDGMECEYHMTVGDLHPMHVFYLNSDGSPHSLEGADWAVLRVLGFRPTQLQPDSVDEAAGHRLLNWVPDPGGANESPRVPGEYKIEGVVKQNGVEIVFHNAMLVVHPKLWAE